MSYKSVYMIINPRAGQDMTRLADVMTIFSAAGWKVDNALVEYNGHATQLAMSAAEAGYDLLIAHGGDGTVNEVLNGMMAVKKKKRQCCIGVLPGGTANQWAHEMGIPLDPIHAALALISSEARKVDVGIIEVQGLQKPATTKQHGQQQAAVTEDTKGREGTAGTDSIHVDKPKQGTRNHFLLTAGFGVDALIISHTPKSLKERIGRAAFEVEAMKEWSQLHSFNTSIDAHDHAQATPLHWEGEALQLIIGNTRLYADSLEFTPNAVIDDGMLDICVLTSHGLFTTIQQAASLLLRHKPTDSTIASLKGASITIAAPASVLFHIDGSAMELADYLDNTARTILSQEEAAQLQVTYHIDVLAKAAPFLVPRTYTGPLFSTHPTQAAHQEEQPLAAAGSDDKELKLHQATGRSSAQPSTLPSQNQSAHQITVVGIAPLAGKKQTYIIAGHSHKQSTGDMKPAAVRVDENTVLYSNTKEQVSFAALEAMPANTVITVEGKISKRGVIKAKCITI